jgi:hypothetical protein
MPSPRAFRVLIALATLAVVALFFANLALGSF